MAISDFALIDLNEVREYPGMTAVPSTQDTMLEGLIDSATFAIEKELKQGLIIRQYVEDYTYVELMRMSPLGNMLYLRDTPVVSVTSMVDPKGTVVPSTAYWIDKVKGIMRGFGWITPQDANGWISYWTITYTAGRFASTEVVDRNLKLAAQIQVADLYKRPSDSIQSKSVGDLHISYKTGAEASGLLSPRVLDLISPYQSIDI